MKRAALLAAALGLACAPAVQPLKGTPTPARALPSLQVPAGHTKIVFRWEYADGDMLTRGEGVFRVAAPDSARLDFFFGGFAGAAALVGDTLRANGPDMVRRLIPPVPLMWAALGKLQIPALADTTVVLQNGLLVADIGRPVEWRVSAREDTLLSLQHIPGGKISEEVTRTPGGDVVYSVPSARRHLKLTIVRTEATGPFDATIWNP